MSFTFAIETNSEIIHPFWLLLEEKSIITINGCQKGSRSITFLSLQGQELTSIPSKIQQLRYCKELYLGANNLTSIPTEIGQLWTLLYLYLDKNRLTSIPSGLGKSVKSQNIMFEQQPINIDS